MSSISLFENGTTIQAQLIDAKYPPYEQVIPRGFSCELTINKESLKGLETYAKAEKKWVREARRIKGMENYNPKLRFNFWNGGTTCKVTCIALDGMVLELKSETTFRDTIDTSFNPAYILDVITCIKRLRIKDDLVVTFTGKNRWGHARPCVLEAGNFKAVIMPYITS